MKTMTLKSRWSRWVSVLLAGVLIVALAGVAQPAAALSWSPKQCTGFSSCNKAGKGNAGYEKVYRKSFWGMNPGHNCTNYVAYRLQKNGVARFTNPGRGTAKHWGAQAKAKGLSVNKSNPKPGDVAWWGASRSGFRSGHVAYVESVNLAAGTFVVSEDNWGGNFDWRTYRISEVSGFIHVGKSAKASAAAPKKAAAKSKSATKPKVFSQAPTPKFSGTTKVDKTLSAKAGTWKPAKVTLKYQWLRNGKPIKGATKAKYKLVRADKGKRISVKVTGSKSGYSALSKTSKQSYKIR